MNTGLLPEAHEIAEKLEREEEIFRPVVSQDSTDLWMPCLQLFILLPCHQHRKCISRYLLMLYFLFEHELGTIVKGQKKPLYLWFDMRARLYLNREKTLWSTYWKMRAINVVWVIKFLSLVETKERARVCFSSMGGWEAGFLGLRHQPAACLFEFWFAAWVK